MAIIKPSHRNSLRADARAFGCAAAVPESLDAFEAAVTAALGQRGVTLIELDAARLGV